MAPMVAAKFMRRSASRSWRLWSRHLSVPPRNRLLPSLRLSWYATTDAAIPSRPAPSFTAAPASALPNRTSELSPSRAVSSARMSRSSAPPCASTASTYLFAVASACLSAGVSSGGTSANTTFPGSCTSTSACLSTARYSALFCASASVDFVSSAGAGGPCTSITCTGPFFFCLFISSRLASQSSVLPPIVCIVLPSSSLRLPSFSGSGASSLRRFSSSSAGLSVIRQPCSRIIWSGDFGTPPFLFCVASSTGFFVMIVSRLPFSLSCRNSAVSFSPVFVLSRVIVVFSFLVFANGGAILSLVGASVTTLPCSSIFSITLGVMIAFGSTTLGFAFVSSGALRGGGGSSMILSGPARSLAFLFFGVSSSLSPAPTFWPDGTPLLYSDPSRTVASV